MDENLRVNQQTLFSFYNIKISLDNNVLKITDFDIEDLLDDIFSNNEFLFQQERAYILILYLFLKQEFVSLNHFLEVLRMSKNTVLSDLSDANNKSIKFEVKIKYTRKEGYELIGEQLKIRKLIDNTVSEILKFSTGKKIIEYIAKMWGIKLYTESIGNLLTQTENISFVKERLKDVIYLIAVLEAGNTIEDKELYLKDEERSYIKNSAPSILTEKIVNAFPKLRTQRMYITIQLLSVVQGDLESDRIDYFKDMLEEIIVNVEGYVGSIFPNTDNFRKNLYNHLVPSYFRMRFQIQLNNPLKEQIIRDYPNLFYLVKQSLKPLSKRTNLDITDDEIAYFVIHFGSYFTSTKEHKSPVLNAIILCPHGMGTSLLLKNLLSSAMPEINFITQVSHIKK
ncbi:PRD domain-containing protein [Tetragenococcus halophilus]